MRLSRRWCYVLLSRNLVSARTTSCSEYKEREWEEELGSLFVVPTEQLTERRGVTHVLLSLYTKNITDLCFMTDFTLEAREEWVEREWVWNGKLAIYTAVVEREQGMFFLLWLQVLRLFRQLQYKLLSIVVHSLCFLPQPTDFFLIEEIPPSLPQNTIPLWQRECLWNMQLVFPLLPFASSSLRRSLLWTESPPSQGTNSSLDRRVHHPRKYSIEERTGRSCLQAWLRVFLCSVFLHWNRVWGQSQYNLYCSEKLKEETNSSFFNRLTSGTCRTFN